MAESSMALKMPPGWTEEDDAVIEDYDCPTAQKGIGACKFVVVDANHKVMYTTDRTLSGPGSKVHLEAQCPDGSDLAKSNGDAERKAITDLLWQITGQKFKESKYKFPDGCTLYVLGNLGPCKGCRGILSAFGKKHNLRIAFVYSIECCPNNTVGGSNGFADATQYNGRWIRVQGQEGIEAAKPDVFVENFLKAWESEPDKKLLKGRAGMLRPKDIAALKQYMKPADHEELLNLLK